MLLHDERGFILRRDSGGRCRLDLRRVAADVLPRRVRVRGVLLPDNVIDVDLLGEP